MYKNQPTLKITFKSNQSSSPLSQTTHSYCVARYLDKLWNSARWYPVMNGNESIAGCSIDMKLPAKSL